MNVLILANAYLIARDCKTRMVREVTSCPSTTEDTKVTKAMRPTFRFIKPPGYFGIVCYSLHQNAFGLPRLKNGQGHLRADWEAHSRPSNRAGGTQAMLADHAELTREHLSELENGKKEIGVRALERITQALELNLHDFFDGF